MPSEYIMYMSMLFVGALAIAGISTTMVSINTTMENKAIETELENILQKISSSIQSLLSAGERQINNGATKVYLASILLLPSEVHYEEYQITVESRDISYLLIATLIDNQAFQVTVTLMIDPEDVSVSGTIQSTDSAPRIVFSYNNGLEYILLESS